MTQLSDDCFAFGGPMMSVDKAVAIIAARVRPVEDIEAVVLAAADGRVLARDISAPFPLPPFPNSAVDGYAVRNADLPQANEAAFQLDGRIAAGGGRFTGGACSACVMAGFGWGCGCSGAVAPAGSGGRAPFSVFVDG